MLSQRTLGFRLPISPSPPSALADTASERQAAWSVANAKGERRTAFWLLFGKEETGLDTWFSLASSPTAPGTGRASWRPALPMVCSACWIDESGRQRIHVASYQSDGVWAKTEQRGHSQIRVWFPPHACATLFSFRRGCAARETLRAFREAPALPQISSDELPTASSTAVHAAVAKGGLSADRRGRSTGQAASSSLLGLTIRPPELSFGRREGAPDASFSPTGSIGSLSMDPTCCRLACKTRIKNRGITGRNKAKWVYPVPRSTPLGDIQRGGFFGTVKE